MYSNSFEIASACENDIEFDKLLPEKSTLLNLETLNSDCQQLILDHLQFKDILNFAETSKTLYVAACLAFKRKYGQCNVGIGEWFTPAFREHYKK